MAGRPFEGVFPVMVTSIPSVVIGTGGVLDSAVGRMLRLMSMGLFCGASGLTLLGSLWMACLVWTNPAIGARLVHSTNSVSLMAL